MNNPLMDTMIPPLQEAVGIIEKQDYDGAIQKLNGIIEVGQIVSQSLVQRGRCHWEMKRWDKALSDFELAVKMEPNNPDIQWTCSLMYLQLGRFPEGWENIDARWKSDRFDSARLKTKTPLWRPGHGRDVLVWSEQGVGDQILYCSMLGTMRSDVSDMLVMVDVRLIPLLERGYPDIRFCPQNVRVKGIDSNIPMGSIGRHYVSELAEIPRVRKTEYLKADPARVEALRAKLGIQPDEFVIGLSWSSAAPAIGDHKSVQLEALSALFDIPNVRVINMQYTNSFKQIYDFEAKTGHRVEVVPSIDNRDDLDGLAALMMLCDCVVSVSNATAHLAGALGVKTFMLDGNKLWFWGNLTSDNRSLWYPSVKTYQRDHVHAPWTPQIHAITNELELLASQKKAGVKPTFVFFHVGNDEKNLTDRLASSIRKVMPDADIIMCTDETTAIPDEVDSVHVGKYDRTKLMTERLRAFAELRLNTPAIYIDSDMEMVSPFDPTKLLGSKDILLCRRNFNKEAIFNPYQRGLDFSEYTGKTIDEVYPYLACATVTRDWTAWSKLYDTLRLFISEKFHIWYGDQEALKICALGESSEKLGSISEAEFACLPEFFEDVNTSAIDVKLIHYKGDRK